MRRVSRRELLADGGRALAAGALLGSPLLSGCRSEREPPSSGAYLQRVSAESAVVGALTPSPSRMVLRWGPNGSELADTYEEPEPVQFHRLSARELLPGADYAWRLETAGGEPVGGGVFRTAAAPGGRFTFQVVGDTGGTERSRGEPIDALDAVHERVRGLHDDENQQWKVAGAMGPRPAELVLHTGDVVYPEGALSDYPEAFFRPFAAVAAARPVIPVVGNHDLKTNDGMAFAATFLDPGAGPLADGRARSFEWGDVHFTLLDTAGEPFGPGSPQGEWAEADLLASERRWKVAVFHVPPLRAMGGEYTDVLEGLVPLLQRTGVDLALCGNDHLYARWFPLGGLTCVTTGGGGKNLYRVAPDPRLAYAESVFHFLEVDVTPRQLLIRAIDATGRAFDASTLEKG